MDLNVRDIWEKTLTLIKSELTEVSFNTWLKTIEPIAIKGKVILLGVPNEFNKEILENRYVSLITNAIKQVTSSSYELEFVIPGDEVYIEEESEEAIRDREGFEAPILNPKYVFDEFVIGNSNRFAHAASLAVAESPARAYNPLFIYGGVGLGKTHLMHAIGHYILDHNSNAKVVYVSSEKFTNELINSIKDDKNEEFRNKYRHVDVLLVDDIQFYCRQRKNTGRIFPYFQCPL